MKKLTAILMLLAFAAVAQPLTSQAEEDYSTATEESDSGMDHSMHMDESDMSDNEGDESNAEEESVDNYDSETQN